MKIDRPNKNVLPPASSSQTNERTIFGSTEQSDDLAANLSDALLRGWGVVGANEAPPKQWFNAMAYTLGGLISHVYQNGIPAWAAQQEYFAGSATLYNGKIYIALTGNAATPNVNKRPDTSPSDWQGIVSDATETVKGISARATIAEAQAGTDDTKFMTPMKTTQLIGSASAANADKWAGKTQWVGAEASLPTTKDANTIYFAY